MISIFTPSHDPQWLDEIYECLLNQTYTNWEWVVLLNGATYKNPDERVKAIEYSDSPANNVGSLKLAACGMATGDYLAEVDHDDLITPDCLEKVVKAFESDPGIGMVYSNTANVRVKGDKWEPITWDQRYGWTYRPVELFGRNVIEARSADPNPQSISRIWFAPNHIRVWRTEAYREIGGHNPDMKISDDHDLICRTYLSRWKIHHIDECLYIYRVHGGNTWLQYMGEIQDTMWANHDRYIQPMMLKWAKDRGLKCLDLCGGHNPTPGCLSVDLKNADIMTDLNGLWPLGDNTVGCIIANDAIEHLRNPIHTMREAHRLLVHGGAFLISVPSTDGRGAFQDPSHVSFWNQNSFWYYTRQEQNKYIDCPVRYQALKVTTTLPNNWCKTNNIPYVQAHLIALKKGERFYGDILI